MAGACPPRRRRWGPPLAAAAALGAARVSQSSLAFRCPPAPRVPQQRLVPQHLASVHLLPDEPRSRPRTPRAALGRTLGTLGLVSGYIFTDVGVFLFTDFSGGGYARSAVMCLSALVSFLLGTGVSWLHGRRRGLLEALDAKKWLRRLPVSGLFCLGTWCTLNAVSQLSPVFVKVLFQMKLPVTVVLSMVLLKRRYTILEIQALSNAFLAVTAFTCLRTGAMGTPVIDGSGVGFVYTASAIFCNVIASLLAERALISGTPWYTTVAHVKAGEAFLSFTLLSLVPRSPLPLGELLQSPSAVFAGWSRPVWCLAIFLVSDAWMSALVVKRLSSVVKALAKSLSMIMLYLIALVVSTESFSLPLFILAVLLTSASQQFAYASRLKQQEERQVEPRRAVSLGDRGGGGEGAAAPREEPAAAPREPRAAAEEEEEELAKEVAEELAEDMGKPKESSRLVYGLKAVTAPNEKLPLAATIPLATMGTLGLAFYLAGMVLYAPESQDPKALDAPLAAEVSKSVTEASG